MDEYLFCADRLPERLCGAYGAFLQRCSLRDERDTDYTALYLSGDGRILACGSLRGNVLKQIAVDADCEGMGLCAGIVTELAAKAAERGETHLFLYTKPSHEGMFRSLGFYPLAAADAMLLMENRRDGLDAFLASLPHPQGRVGSVVCNCNPFTLGHRRLIETAAGDCDGLIVFVLSEELSLFSASERYEMVKAGTRGLDNVFVVESRDYLVSRATFPTYFIKEQAQAQTAACELDIALFAKRIAPALNITARYVGEEPYDAVTREYNEAMKRTLPKHGVELIELPRYLGISAGRVRQLLREGRLAQAKELLPDSTYEYCERKFGAGARLSGGAR